MINRNRLPGFVLVALAIAAGMSPRIFIRAVSAQSGSASKIPIFEVDTTWPPLPNNWVLGNVSKVVSRVSGGKIDFRAERHGERENARLAGGEDWIRTRGCV